MVDGKRTQQLKKEDIKMFLQAYISEYRTFLEENYPQRKNDFSLYAGYPLDIKAYVSEKSTLIVYKFDAPSLRIKVVAVDCVPNRETIQKDASEGYLNAYLSRIINKPQDVARQKILSEIAYEEYEKQQEEYYAKLDEEYERQQEEYYAKLDEEYEKQQEYYDKLYEEAEVDATIKGYLDYLETAYDVKKETSEQKRNEIYSAINLVNEHTDYYFGYLKTGCTTLFAVMFELNEDIESSIFLSIHGKYRPANALLRRWLETTIYALYFDFELKKYNKNTKTYEKTLEKRNKWLKKPYHLRFTGDNFSILAIVIDPDTDYIAMQLMKKTTSDFSKSSFRRYVENIYRLLSKSVHYGGMNLLEDGLPVLGFAEYNEKLFREWYVKLKRIHEICNILTLLKFPEMLTLQQERFPTLEEKQMRKLKELLKIK